MMYSQGLIFGTKQLSRAVFQPINIVGNGIYPLMVFLPCKANFSPISLYKYNLYIYRERHTPAWDRTGRLSATPTQRYSTDYHLLFFNKSGSSCQKVGAILPCL